MMTDLLAAVGVLFVLGSVVIITKLYARCLNPETSRKIIHITMGCVALSFPYIFTYKLSVVCLGVLALAALLFLRKNKVLREGVGTALLGISRRSFGEIYFVISIVIVFVLHKSVFAYLIPISILTFADSAAALIGTSYGRTNLAHAQEDAKSSEGSLIFFIVAFICTLVPLQLMTETGRAEVLVISFLIGLLAAMIELVSTNGNDNLLLPLLTYGFLRYNSEQSLDILFTNFGVMLFFSVAIFFVYKITNISKLSIVYSLLVAYIIMVQGGMIWILPPLTLFLTFGILPMMKGEEKQLKQTYEVVESNSITGVICLWVSVFYPQYRDILYIAFSLSFACHLAVNTYSRFVNFVKTGKSKAIFCALTKAVVFIALPTFVFAQMNWAVFVLYVAFVAASMPPLIFLNKKYDYSKVGRDTLRANTILVGSLTAFFTLILMITVQFYDLFR